MGGRGYSCEQSPHPHPAHTQVEDAEDKQGNKKVYNTIKRNKSGPEGQEEGLGWGCISMVVWEGLSKEGIFEGRLEEMREEGIVFHTEQTAKSEAWLPELCFLPS